MNVADKAKNDAAWYLVQPIHVEVAEVVLGLRATGKCMYCGEEVTAFGGCEFNARMTFVGNFKFHVWDNGCAWKYICEIMERSKGE